MSGLLINEQFVAVFPSLVRRLGDMNLAALLQTIWFHTDRRTGEAIVTHAELSELTGIPLRTVKRGMAKLRELEHVESRRLSPTDATCVWRVIDNSLTSESATLVPPREPLTSESATLVPEAECQSGTLSSTKNPEETTSDADAPTRIEIERLCKHLADRIEGNGSKRPAITKRWREACRLLLDRDGRTDEQVHRAIDWCQDHEFWRGVIRSMPKLRDQYDALRLQAMRTTHHSPVTPAVTNLPEQLEIDPATGAPYGYDVEASRARSKARREQARAEQEEIDRKRAEFERTREQRRAARRG